MSKKKRTKSNKKRNPVARNLHHFNKATTQRDKKKDKKRGYNKHKKRAYDFDDGHRLFSFLSIKVRID